MRLTALEVSGTRYSSRSDSQRAADRGVLEQCGREDLRRDVPVQKVVGLQPVGQRDVRLLDVARGLADRKAPVSSAPPQRSPGLEQPCAKEPGRAEIALEHQLLRIALVATEDLVAAVAGQEPLEAVLARDARTVIGSRGRRIAERLGEGRGEFRQRCQHVVRRDVVLERRGAEMARRDARVLHLVVALSVEAHGYGRQPGHQLGRQSGHRRTVETAAQERSAARASLERAADRCAQPPQQLRRRLGFTEAGMVLEARPPVTLDSCVLAVPVQAMPAVEFRHALEDRSGAGQHVEVDVAIERVEADARRFVPRGGQAIGPRGDGQFRDSRSPVDQPEPDAGHDDGGGCRRGVQDHTGRSGCLQGRRLPAAFQVAAWPARPRPLPGRRDPVARPTPCHPHWNRR